ncbi:MAG: type II secretion system GspH family protein [Thermotogae bacterium]|jgi:prepilin-type N-terminal cleavage/methylation domain-containing protein|nr:type II secretion system GspH family protein [Thermotogota bacterium]MCL5033458.1 type II secretion system GspH family protein [Thermotogota bacterium]
MRKKREGFTLIELLIVMAVIAALMGALVPVALSAIQHANATRIAENLQSLVTQVQQYAYSEHVIPKVTTLATSVSGGNVLDYTIYVSKTPNGPYTTNTGTAIKSQQVYFAVNYNLPFDALTVYKVWKGVAGFSTAKNIVAATKNTSPVATGVVVRYW